MEPSFVSRTFFGVALFNHGEEVAMHPHFRAEPVFASRAFFGAFDKFLLTHLVLAVDVFAAGAAGCRLLAVVAITVFPCAYSVVWTM